MKLIPKYQKAGKLNFKTTGLPWQQSKQNQETARNAQSTGTLNSTNLKRRLQPAAKNLKAKYNNLSTKERIALAKRSIPHSEIVTVKDQQGNTKTSTNPQAGAMSGADPVGEFVVGTAAGNLGLGLGKIALSKMSQNAVSHWARNSLLNETAGNLTKNMSQGITNNLAAKEYTTGDNPIMQLSYYKPTRKAWSTGKAEGNRATSYFFKQQPNQRFELVKDIEPNNYSIHFKTDRNGLSYGNKMQLFAKVADEVPEGANLSTWGSVSKGGIHGVNRFGKDFGFIQNGTRQLTMKGTKEPVKVGIYTKINKNIQQFLDTPEISELVLKESPPPIRGKGWTDAKLNFTNNDVTNLYKEYASQLSEINPLFNNPDYINNFKLFLHNKGYKAKLSDEEITKIITDNYNQLKTSNTGLVKGKVFWNASPTRYYQQYNDNGNIIGGKIYITKAAPESFKKIDPKLRTSPSDVEGVYFSRQPYYQYFYPKEYTNTSSGYYTLGNTGYDMQPYLLGDIKNMVELGTKSSKILGNSFPKNIIKYTTEFKGNSSAYKPQENPSQYFNGEYIVNHNTPIKSLYPHPETLSKDTSGKIILHRSWNDPRIHYSLIPVGMSLPFLNNSQK